VSARPASLDELARVHTAEYIEAVQRASREPQMPNYRHGLGTPDVPAFAGMHEASAVVAGATLVAARSVHDGELTHAMSPAGGLHHAMPDTAAGFCVYNDVALAIAYLLDVGVERVAYIDVDVHHGDGVEHIFWDDPRVMTISIHESPGSLYPGTGWADDVGGASAEGFAVNIPLPAGTGDAGWLRALCSVAPQLLAAFSPQVLVSQHGCDSHVLDPLAHLSLSIDGQRRAAELVHGWGHEYADGKWVASGGGGYAIVDVVPRIWALVMAELSGHPIPAETTVPEAWRRYVAKRLNQVAPLRMTDGAMPVVSDWRSGYDPADSVDRAISSTRRAVFPHQGLDPDRD
jgi:acetoin utilization protein AcuC